MRISHCFPLWYIKGMGLGIERQSRKNKMENILFSVLIAFIPSLLQLLKIHLHTSALRLLSLFVSYLKTCSPTHKFTSSLNTWHDSSNDAFLICKLVLCVSSYPFSCLVSSSAWASVDSYCCWVLHARFWASITKWPTFAGKGGEAVAWSTMQDCIGVHL